jgi:hypothetical protein
VQILHQIKLLVAKMHIPCDNLIYGYVICNLQFELKTSQLKMHVKLGRVPLINALHEECNVYAIFTM